MASYLNKPATEYPTFMAMIREHPTLVAGMAHKVDLPASMTIEDREALLLDSLWKAYEWATKREYPGPVRAVWLPVLRDLVTDARRKAARHNWEVLVPEVGDSSIEDPSPDLDAWISTLAPEDAEVARLMAQGHKPGEIKSSTGLSQKQYRACRTRLAVAWVAPEAPGH